MYYRLKWGDAKLLCYSDDGDDLQAYGWIQSWKQFKREFRMISGDGVLLGPFWTAPSQRGKGLYGKLLQHCLFHSPATMPVFIYTSPENTSSQRGILKAGFELVGEWIISMWFRCIVCSREISGHVEK